MRRIDLAFIPFVLLTACPGHPIVPPADGGDAIADGAVDGPEDTPQADVVMRPDVLRCGPGAIPLEDTLGPCAVELPLPDGGMPPPGQCTATVNTPVGTRMANETEGNAIVLINGRRIQRAAHRLALSGFPAATLLIPGTHLVVVSDGGIDTEHLRVIDTSANPPAIVPGGDVTFMRDGSGRDPALFYGLAYDPTARVLYASGGGGNRIYAYTVATSGALTPDVARTIDLGLAEGISLGWGASGLNSAYVSGLALSADGATLYAALNRGETLAIYPTANPSAVRYVRFEVTDPLQPPTPYAVITRPGDPAHVYVSLVSALQVAEVDTNTAMVTRTFHVGKNPEELLFSPDGARLLVAASDSDAIEVIDVSMPSAPVHTTYLGGSATAPRGISPSALTWGPMNRLYVVEADQNAIDVLDGNTLARIGRIPTEWYPTDVEVEPDGTVIVTHGKGIGAGPNITPGTLGVTDTMSGSIARYAAPTAMELTDGDALVTTQNSVPTTFNDVSCPSGATYDFPVPRIGSSGGSTRIRHVVFVIRENKTYDALLGDYAGTTGDPANGDPTLTFSPLADMPDLNPNFHRLVRTFGHGDNYYSNAEQSLQGHVRTANGRSTDYNERTWLTSWGRGSRTPPDQGVTTTGIPEEGGIFAAMNRASVSALDWGETACDATPAQRAGGRYPGLVFNMGVPDIQKARAFADWVQGTNNVSTNPLRMCVLPSFTYILLPNDHTKGFQAGRPTPTSYIQDNDEATGFLIDALSHSRFWPETLVVVVEDDPSDGGDHVDNHRSVVLLASPWVRRGHTSHVHYDESSIHHTIELILGVPAHNAVVASAAPMYDLFTSTPDFTPFRYEPRHACEQLNPMGGRLAEQSSQMDFSQPDNAPGLSRMLWEGMHGRPAPWRAAPAESDGDGD